ncbi:MAG: hypothetical protein GH142_04975 [Dehalococcoidia bacterium]|nr:hypothetical protein [Dehalococcoidia bacterium]
MWEVFVKCQCARAHRGHIGSQTAGAYAHIIDSYEVWGERQVFDDDQGSLCIASCPHIKGGDENAIDANLSFSIVVVAV